MSSESKPPGGILRSKPKPKRNNGDRSSHVTFSSNNETSTFLYDNPGRDHEEIETSRQTGTSQDYDSDDDDVILASGDGLSMNTRQNHDEHVNEPYLSSKEIEQAKRRRGDARHHMDDFDNEPTTYQGDNNLSLITDVNADPDEYHSNAGTNASCPVEPFNMDAEKEGGLGYFDGDTYVFRKNKVEGEEDAWLDGFEEENEENMNDTQGGLDSMSIWKPNEKKVGKTKASKYVIGGETQEEIAARLLKLLENEETVMMALARHGSTLRQLQNQEQKMAKKNSTKKRKSKPDTESENASSIHDGNIDQVKDRIKQVRDIVEELTELADALLFEGETEAYELTKADWIHRFKLDTNDAKRPTESLDEAPSKKSRHNYFGSSPDNDTTKQPDVKTQCEGVMWEYKGNEDGVIHGPFTSQQMLEWTSCGYFVGASAVDIRRVGETEDTTDVDDLMADLMDNDDEEKADGADEWMRSDAVDFNAYLR